jgi:hypothetical protein
LAGLGRREAMIFEIPIASKMNPMKVKHPKGESPRNGPEKMKPKNFNATMPPPTTLKPTPTPLSLARCLSASSGYDIGGMWFGG